MTIQQIDRYRVGRNFIRVGDYAKATPSKPGKHDGFIGKVSRIDATDGDPEKITAVHLQVLRTLDGKERHVKAGMSRALFPERIEKVDQVRIRRLIDDEAALA